MSLPLRRHACRVRTVMEVTDAGTDIVQRTSGLDSSLRRSGSPVGDGRGRQVRAGGTGRAGPICRVVVSRAGPAMRSDTRYTAELVVRQEVTGVCLARPRVAGTFRGSSGFK